MFVPQDKFIHSGDMKIYVVRASAQFRAMGIQLH
jgi:hypothetical protein